MVEAQAVYEVVLFLKTGLKFVDSFHSEDLHEGDVQHDSGGNGKACSEQKVFRISFVRHDKSERGS